MSRVARFWSSWRSSALVVVLALAGCGGGWQPKVEGPYLQSKLQYWLVRPHGKPKAIVVLVHGLTQNTGEQLVPWQKHLAEQGDAVVFPRYEAIPGDPTARYTIAISTFQAIDRLRDPNVPLIVVGHSRGGRLAVEAAADLKPRMVISLFPGVLNASFELPTDLRRIPPTTRIYLYSADHDDVVGARGVRELVQRLHAAGRTAHVAVIHSGNGFTATHDSVYGTDPATQRVIWARVDRLIASAEG